MRILIDESLPRKLKNALSDHSVVTVRQMWWSGIKNGRLLGLMSNEFDVFITADQNFEYQQNLSQISIAIFVLKVFNTKLETISPLLPSILEALKNVKPGTIIHFSEK